MSSRTQTATTEVGLVRVLKTPEQQKTRNKRAAEHFASAVPCCPARPKIKPRGKELRAEPVAYGRHTNQPHLAPEFRKVVLTCVTDESCVGDGLDSSNVTVRLPFSNATNEGGGSAADAGTTAGAGAAATNVGASVPLPETAAAGAPAGVPAPPDAGAKGLATPAAGAGAGCGCGCSARTQACRCSMFEGRA